MKIKGILLMFACMAALQAVAQEKPIDGNSDKLVTKESATDFYHTPYKDRSNGTYGLGANLFSLSYGFPNNLYNDAIVKTFGAGASSFGPLLIRDEFAVHEEVGVAIMFQYAHKKWMADDGGGDLIEISTKGIGIGALGVYHFNKVIPVRKIDVYLGLGLGFGFDSGSALTTYYALSGSRQRVKVLAIAGLRYYFSKGFGVFVEGGSTGYSLLNTGLTVRFK